jgi:hypothetical protein
MTGLPCRGDGPDLGGQRTCRAACGAVALARRHGLMAGRPRRPAGAAHLDQLHHLPQLRRDHHDRCDLGVVRPRGLMRNERTPVATSHPTALRARESSAWLGVRWRPRSFHQLQGMTPALTNARTSTHTLQAIAGSPGGLPPGAERTRDVHAGRHRATVLSMPEPARRLTQARHSGLRRLLHDTVAHRLIHPQ